MSISGRKALQRRYFKKTATFAAFDDFDASIMVSENEKYEHQLSKRVAAYSTFEVVSSLIFGFSASVLFSEVITQEFEDEILENVFLNLLCLVLVLSGYSLIAVSITHYFVNRFLADYKYGVAMKYLSMYRAHRKWARRSFYISIPLLLVSLGVFLVDHATHTSAKVVSSSILGCGAVFLTYAMYSMLNPNKYLKSGTHKKSSGTPRGAHNKSGTMMKKFSSADESKADSDSALQSDHEQGSQSNDATPPVATVAVAVPTSSTVLSDHEIVKLKKGSAGGASQSVKRMLSTDPPYLNGIPEHSDPSGSDESAEEKSAQPSPVRPSAALAKHSLHEKKWTIRPKTYMKRNGTFIVNHAKTDAAISDNGGGEEGKNLQLNRQSTQSSLRLSQFQPSPPKQKSVMSRLSADSYAFNASLGTDTGGIL